MRVAGGPSSATDAASTSDHDNLRVGVDLVDVDQVATSLRDFGTRYTDRIFTSQENADCAGPSPARDRSLAARFAAKEATLKVLRVTTRVPTWTDIEVVRTDAAPELHLHGLAAELAIEQDLSSWAMSLAHEGRMAVAVVLAMRSSANQQASTAPPNRKRGDTSWTTSSAGS